MSNAYVRGVVGNVTERFTRAVDARRQATEDRAVEKASVATGGLSLIQPDADLITASAANVARKALVRQPGKSAARRNAGLAFYRLLPSERNERLIELGKSVLSVNAGFIRRMWGFSATVALAAGKTAFHADASSITPFMKVLRG